MCHRLGARADSIASSVLPWSEQEAAKGCSDTCDFTAWIHESIGHRAVEDHVSKHRCSPAVGVGGEQEAAVFLLGSATLRVCLSVALWPGSAGPPRRSRLRRTICWPCARPGHQLLAAIGRARGHGERSALCVRLCRSSACRSMPLDGCLRQEVRLNGVSSSCSSAPLGSSPPAVALVAHLPLCRSMTHRVVLGLRCRRPSRRRRGDDVVGWVRPRSLACRRPVLRTKNRLALRKACCTDLRAPHVGTQGQRNVAYHGLAQTWCRDAFPHSDPDESPRRSPIGPSNLAGRSWTPTFRTFMLVRWLLCRDRGRVASPEERPTQSSAEHVLIAATALGLAPTRVDESGSWPRSAVFSAAIAMRCHVGVPSSTEGLERKCVGRGSAGHSSESELSTNTLSFGLVGPRARRRRRVGPFLHLGGLCRALLCQVEGPVGLRQGGGQRPGAGPPDASHHSVRARLGRLGCRVACGRRRLPCRRLSDVGLLPISPASRAPALGGETGELSDECELAWPLADIIDSCLIVVLGCLQSIEHGVCQKRRASTASSAAPLDYLPNVVPLSLVWPQTRPALGNSRSQLCRVALRRSHRLSLELHVKNGILHEKGQSCHCVWRASVQIA